MPDFWISKSLASRTSECLHIRQSDKETRAIYITIIGFKGGVGKTTCAVHLAAYLQERAPTLLVDGDLNRSALAWAEAGRLPFAVVDELDAARAVKDYKHIVIDTAARPAPGDLCVLAQNSDLMILPTTAEAMALRALLETARALEEIGGAKYRALVTIVPPRPSRDGDEARASLSRAGLPVFSGTVRRGVAFSKASLQGCLVSKVHDPRAQACWADFARIGEEMIGGVP